MLNLSNMRDWIGFCADICMLFITLYTFYLTFIRIRLNFCGIGENNSNSDGKSFYVIIENRFLLPVVINNVNLIMNDKYKICLTEMKDPLIIESFCAKRVESKKYAKLYPNNVNINFEESILEVITTKKVLYLKLNKKAHISKKMKKMKAPNVCMMTYEYNNKIVPENAVYSLDYIRDSKNHTVFIFKSGILTENILGYTAVPVENMNNKKQLEEFLDKFFVENGVEEFYLRDIHT